MDFSNYIPLWENRKILMFSSAVEFTKNMKVYLGPIGQNLVYNGNITRRPGDNRAFSVLNDIMSQYLMPEVPKNIDQPTFFQGTGLSSEVNVQVGERQFNLLYRYDWSYDDTYDPGVTGGVLSAPITGDVIPGQFLPFTKAGTDKLTTITTVDVNGVSTDVLVEGDREFNYLKTVTEDMDQIIINGLVNFKVVHGCEKIVLYYVNEHGGWDSLILKGREIKMDSYDRKTYRREGDDTNHTVVNYHTDIRRSYELHTGYLTGDQGKMMHQVIGSPMVFMHDIEKNAILPVNIMNQECEYKTYHNQGGELYEYIINVEVSRDYMRK